MYSYLNQCLILFYSPYSFKNTLFYEELKFDNSEKFLIKIEKDNYLNNYLRNLLSQNIKYIEKNYRN